MEYKIINKEFDSDLVYKEINLRNKIKPCENTVNIIFQCHKNIAIVFVDQ